MGTTPEHRLVLRACKAALGFGGETEIAPAVAAVEHWDEVVRWADRHAVFPLAYRALAAAIARGATGIPSSVMADLRARFDENALRNIELARHLLELAEQFAASGIPFMPIKGPALAVSAYGDLAMRQFGDLDLVIHRRDLDRVRAIVEADGFRPLHLVPPSLDALVVETDYHLPLEHPGRGVMLELHWALGRSGFGALQREDWAWTNARSVSLLGRQLHSLSWEAEVVYLCAHGSKHNWSQLARVCDVLATVRAAGAIDWDRTRVLASRSGLARMLRVGLALGESLLGVDLAALGWTDTPDAGLRALVDDATARCMSGHDGREPASMRDEMMFQLRSRERVLDRVVYSLDVVLSPHISDLGAMTLPRGFRLLYYVSRPLRLAAKYARRLVAR